MLRVRFETNDQNPVNWPIKYPCWCTGFASNGKGYFCMMVTYAENIEYVKNNWPDARNIDVLEKNAVIKFTSRFQKPEWYKGE